MDDVDDFCVCLDGDGSVLGCRQSARTVARVYDGLLKQAACGAVQGLPAGLWPPLRLLLDVSRRRADERAGIAGAAGLQIPHGWRASHTDGEPVIAGAEWWVNVSHRTEEATGTSGFISTRMRMFQSHGLIVHPAASTVTYPAAVVHRPLFSPTRPSAPWPVHGSLPRRTSSRPRWAGTWTAGCSMARLPILPPRTSGGPASYERVTSASTYGWGTSRAAARFRPPASEAHRWVGRRFGYGDVRIARGALKPQCATAHLRAHAHQSVRWQAEHAIALWRHRPRV